MGMPLVFILLIYIGISLRFLNSYCYGTIINGVDCTGKKESEVENELISGLGKYQLVIKDRQGNKFTVTSHDIQLNWDVADQLKKIKNGQNCFFWILNASSNKIRYQVKINVTYNELLLHEKIKEFGLLNQTETVEPVNAYISLEDNGYVIIPEVPGSSIDENKLEEGLIHTLKLRQRNLDLVKYGCYDMPEITSDSDVLSNTMQAIRFFETANITYDFDIEKVELTKRQIDSFIEIEDNIANVSENRVRNYIVELKDKYDTVGIPRDFVTSDGRKIEVSKGNYGFDIAKEVETKWLTQAISSGLWAVREPEYITKAFQRGISDIGNTYIEIDLSRQHMWYYEKGSLIVDTDVVTGNISKGYGTPAMVACIQYKQRDATLNGENYSTPVDYWMPIYKNIGIHDASWRSSFGGQIYKRNGSHGCINTPYKKVKVIYEKVEVGTPVILYY